MVVVLYPSLPMESLSYGNYQGLSVVSLGLPVCLSYSLLGGQGDTLIDRLHLVR